MAVDPYGRQQPGQKKQNTIPQNPKLWEMLTNQAKAKFRTYPSLPASKWIHEEYVKRGGVFVASKKKDSRHDKSGHETSEGKKDREQHEKQSDSNKSKAHQGVAFKRKAPERKVII